MRAYLRELWYFRELFWAMCAKEIKIRYKQTLLGAVWAILQPVSLALIFSVVFGIFLKVESSGIPYIIFAYSALLPWTFFTTAVSFGALSVVNNGGLVTKIYFPREILPLASVGAAFFDFLMASGIFAVMILIYKLPLTSNFFYLLVFIPSMILLTIGISLILSTLNVLFRDIRFVVPLVLQIWLYLSPVIYSLDQVPDRFRVLILLNPMTPLVQGFRDVTVFGKPPELSQLILSLSVSLVIFVLGYLFFKSREKFFADVI